jgi:CheY-like chemotaxis protein
MTKRNVLIAGLHSAEAGELNQWLTRHGHQGWVTGSAIEALRVFEEIEPDTVLLDTLLPGGDPERVARTLYAASPSLRVVFVGNHHFEEAYFGALSGLGAVSFAHRPLDPNDFFDRSGDAEGEDQTLRGALSAQSFGEALADLYRRSATGVLYVGAGARQRLVYLRDGHPVYAASTILDENFGRFLVRSERISQIEFDWARKLQLREGVRQGEALVKIGVLTEQDLREALGLQIREKILNCFVEPDSRFHFEPGRTARHTEPAYGLDVLGIVYDGLALGRWTDAATEVWPAQRAWAYKLRLTGERATLRRIEELLERRVVAALEEGTDLGRVNELVGSPGRALALRDTLELFGVLERV